VTGAGVLVVVLVGMVVGVGMVGPRRRGVLRLEKGRGRRSGHTGAFEDRSG